MLLYLLRLSLSLSLTLFPLSVLALIAAVVVCLVELRVRCSFSTQSAGCKVNDF